MRSKKHRSIHVLCVLALAAFVVRPACDAVIITDATDEGIHCFKITTNTATYYYDKAGAGFTSILDRDGIDWINFDPKGTPNLRNGAAGWYRGIPNMGLNEFGHPGYSGATSTTTDEKDVPLPRAIIRSVKDKWSITWQFFPNYAKMTVHSVGENYWFLYEGTPGGTLDSEDTCWRSSNSGTSCDRSWEGDISNASNAAVGSEWIYFADGVIDRSLFLIHNDDPLTDLYFRMGPMTVFGFGRQRSPILSRLVSRLSRILGVGDWNSEPPKLMSSTPAILVIGFVNSRDFDTVKSHIDAVYKSAVSKGNEIPQPM